MKPERFQQIDRLFDEVLDAPTADRDEILAARCGSDTDLKREVLKLLGTLNIADDFIETSDFTPLHQFIEPDADEYIGKKIGAYKIKKLLGRGGMSAVYLAARIDDFEKEAALKIVPPLENRRGSAENFRRERQILARLEHPNIARILDGGTTETGKPYIVMEYVDGLPLNRFCAENALVEREKLELFQQVCNAVTYAHQNLIVHRDLKPSNIFVAQNGAVKLLDFGIAKLLDADNFHPGENQTFDGNALTLEYASPEQIAGENITVASDVYSLGVVLYELLTGVRPHDFQNTSLGEILRIVQTETSPAPSVVKGEKKSELDLIVLKSLAKDVSERYQNTNDFCNDIKHYLADEPIAARPATAFYRFKKYVRRHRAESVAALFVIFLIVGWLVTFAYQYRRERIQADENRRAAYSAEMILAANEYENANLNRLREILEKYQPDDKNDAEDVRGFEWHFLDNLLNPPSKLASFRLPDEIWHAQFSPDGKFIAAATNDNRVRVFDLTTQTAIETVEQKGAWRIAFFPDGKRFAVSSSSNDAPLVRIYETATAREVFTFRGHQKRVRSLTVSPDGKLIASGSQDGTMIVWDAATGVEIKRVEFSTAAKQIELQALQFSRSGTRLAALGFETLVVFDTKSWKPIVVADFQKLLDRNIFLSGWDLAFSPLDKTIAAATFEGDVVFFDAATLDVIRVLKLHQANVKSLAFSADGKILATASWDRTVKFTDVPTGETINELRGHFAGVHAIAFAPDGKTLLTAGADFYLNLWNTAQVAAEKALLTSSSIFAFAADGKTGIGWNNSAGELSLFDLESKRRVWTAKHSINALAIAFDTPSNKIALGEKDGFVSIFDADEGKLLNRFRAHDHTIYAIRFTNEGTAVFTAHEDGMLKALDTTSVAEKFAVKADTNILRTLAQSPDSRFLAVGGNNKNVRIYDAANGAELKILTGHTKPLYRAVFSNDGATLATMGADDAVKIWRTSDWQLVREFSGMSAGVFAAAFSPDGKRLATASDVGVIRLWNLETGAQVLAFTADQKQIVNLKFFADGATLMSFDINGKVKFWSAH